MYTTKPLTLSRNFPESISTPPDGPNSGFLVLDDEESKPTNCFGLGKSSTSIDYLPFPQNKVLIVKRNAKSTKRSYNGYDKVYLIPVLNQPLSSYRYYVIKADGKRKGEAYASSKEDDMGTYCFSIPRVRDLSPRPLDPNDIYQQFEFSLTKTFTNKNKLVAKSVAPDGHPPRFLRRRGWKITTQTPKSFTMGEANGLNTTTHIVLPDFNFPLSEQSSNSKVVGKWYCPFMFIKEQTLIKDQVKNSVFYEMTLEQRWERVFTSKSRYDQRTKPVMVDVAVQTTMVRIFEGDEAIQNEDNNDGTNIVLFTSVDGDKEVGLSRLIVERMMWEEERVGWVNGKGEKVRVVKKEHNGGIMWTNYGCYVLVESFSLKRNDGSLVLTYEFRHTHQTKSKWE